MGTESESCNIVRFWSGGGAMPADYISALAVQYSKNARRLAERGAAPVCDAATVRQTHVEMVEVDFTCQECGEDSSVLIPGDALSVDVTCRACRATQTLDLRDEGDEPAPAPVARRQASVSSRGSRVRAHASSLAGRRGTLPPSESVSSHAERLAAMRGTPAPVVERSLFDALAARRGIQPAKKKTGGVSNE